MSSAAGRGVTERHGPGEGEAGAYEGPIGKGNCESAAACGRCRRTIKAPLCKGGCRGKAVTGGLSQGVT